MILTDVDGLYMEPPQGAHAKPEKFDVVDRITAAVKQAAGGSESAFGRGGMITKLEAAKSAASSGAATVLCNGTRRDTLLRVAAGEAEGTLFRAGERMRGRKHWIAFTAKTRGTLRCDAGAVRALVERGRSLLPAGVVAVEGPLRHRRCGRMRRREGASVSRAASAPTHRATSSASRAHRRSRSTGC